VVCAVAEKQLFIITAYYPDEDVWVEGELLVIDNLPAKVCLHCGESIVDYNTMEKINKKMMAARKFEKYLT
jgi:YgiT-type zinc finger domain-containing protein